MEMTHPKKAPRVAGRFDAARVYQPHKFFFLHHGCASE